MSKKILKLQRVWGEGNIKNLLCPIERELNIRPGDLIQIGALRLPIFDISYVIGGVKFTVLYSDQLPSVDHVEVIEVSPSKGKVFVAGDVPHPIISIIRQNGYDVVYELSDDVDVIIVTKPDYLDQINDIKVIIAPDPSLPLTDYHYLNEWFDEKKIGLMFNLNKPFMFNKPKKIGFSYFLREVFVPSLPQAYSIKVFRGNVLSQVDEKIVVAAVSSVREVVALSSIYFLYPYDLVYGEGQNSYLLIDLIKSDFSKFLTVELEEEEIIETRPQVEFHELLVEANGLPENKVFQVVLEKLTKFGGIVKSRNDARRNAKIILESLGLLETPIEISVRAGKVLISSDPSVENRILRSVHMLVKEVVDELLLQKTKRDQLKMLIRLMSQLHRKLLLVKDMVELDMNSGEVIAELSDVIALMKKNDVFKELALEMEGYLVKELSNLDRLKPIPEDKKIELEEKLDEWYNSIVEEVEKII